MVSHGAFPVVGGSTRCACTLNTFDTMEYGYLNAIRARARMLCPHRVKIPLSSGGNSTGAGISPPPLPRDPNGSLASTVVPTGECPINRPGGLHRFYMAF